MSRPTCLYCGSAIVRNVNGDGRTTCRCPTGVRVGNARNPTDEDDDTDSDTFEASRKAAQATVATGHKGAGSRAVAALDALKAGNPSEAIEHHLAASKIHKNEAQDERNGRFDVNDGEDHEANADAHDKAASLQQKAASKILDTIANNRKGATMNRQPSFEEIARQDQLHRELVENSDTPLSMWGTEEGTLSLPTMNYTDDLYTTPKPTGKDKGKASGSNADVAEQEDRMGTDAQYGDAPTVRKSDERGRVTPNEDEELENDGLISPSLIDVLFDGRGTAELKRKGTRGAASVDQQKRDSENARHLAMSTNANISYPGQSDLLIPARIDWATGGIG